MPEYVRITIYSQIRRLLSTSCFIRENDLDDITQDLILYYLEKFYQRKIPSEAYVVTSLQNEAKKLLRTKVRQRFGLYCSLEDLEEQGKTLKIDGGFEHCEMNLIISNAAKHLSERENHIIKMIGDGHTIDDISKHYHISKNTIYKIFEKIKKNYEK